MVRKLGSYMFLLAVLLAMTAGGASAATITYSSAYPSETTYDLTDWNYTLALQQFNPSLGTLNSITFTLYGYLQTDADYASLEEQYPIDISVNVNGTIALTLPSSYILTASPTVTMTDMGLNPGQANSQTGFGEATASYMLTSPADFGLFTGTSAISLPVSASATSWGVASGGNASFDIFTFARAYATVTYDYTVPEPVTLVLVGGALVGLGLMGRKRFTRQM